MDVDQGLVLKLSEVQLLIDILLEASPEYPSDLLDTDPHPSDFTLALFAEGVYIDKNSGETDKAYEERLNLPEGWRLLLTGYNLDLNNGYFGAAFIHIQLQQVVIAHRGTIVTKVGTLYTDFVGIFMNKYTNCMNSALTFTDHVRQIIDVVNAKPHNRCYNLTITGHSLGGWLSQVTAFTAKWLKVSNGGLVKNIGGGVHAKIVAFDSPGAKKILDKMREDYYTNYGMIILGRLDITTYVSAPNVINTCGLHLGTVYRVFIDFSKFDRKDLMETSSYNGKTHAISNFVEAFKTSTPNISEVLDWAKDSNEYRSLFENEMLNLDNNYHVNFEKFNKTEFLDKIVKHYHVLPQSNSFSMHLNAFSEPELQLLYQLIFFQMHQTDLKILNKFMTFKNLTFKNDKIFPDFEIHHANRTIKCQSMQMLKELTRRLKQLMRWFGSEFKKAVEEQIWSLPRAIDSFYRAEGESYLELLPRSTLNFKDSLGLRDFLLSDTKQILSIISPDGEFEMCRLQNVLFQIKKSVNASDAINKYTNESHFTFLDWPRLQKLFKIGTSPFDQNNLMIVDGSSPSAINSEVRFFFNNNYLQCSSSEMKKLVFISSNSYLGQDIFNSLEKVKEVKIDQSIGLMDLSTESLETLLQRKLLSIGNKINNSFHDFLLENCPLSQINQFISSDIFKKITFNKDYIIVVKDTRPLIYDLQMPMIKTNIVTNKEHVFNCANLPNTLVVIGGLNHGDLETGAAWEQLKGKIILAEGNADQIFKYTCDKNQHKTIYLFEVSGDARTDIHCKQIFNRDFYVPRKFVHRSSINIHKFTEATHVDEMFVVCCEEDKASLLGLIRTSEKREEISKNLQIASTKEGEERVIQKYFNKNIHFVKIEQSAQNFEIEWRFSHGSVKKLLRCMSTDSFEPIDELTLSQTERNLVILIDEPGMGKTTTLARLSRLIETSWVIHIEFRQFTAHVDSLPDQFTPQNVSIFLLSQCCSIADDGLAHGLLEYFLLSKKTFSKRVVLMFDGFDEIDDYIKNKDSSIDKLVKLFIFLQSKPAIQVFLTARKYLKESLETKLSQLSTSFVTIDTQEQQHFLFKFWQSFLPLELSSDREKAKGGLTEYSVEVLRRAKRVLGPDIDCFMGVPLQLRMVAEVFRPQSDLLIQPLEYLYNNITIVSAPNLYKMYVNLKYDIYLHDKTIKGSALDEDEILDYTKSLNKDHGELGFKMFFPNFYDKNFEAITDKKLVKLNRLGLVQSEGNRKYHFTHRTYAEYFCGQIVVHWLIHRDSDFKYQLIKDVLLPKILLHPESKVIRLLMNVELEEIKMSDTILQSNAEQIGQLWFETNDIFRNDEDNQTAVHIAVKERNQHILALLLSGLHYKSTQEAFVSLITQYDHNNETALHVIDQAIFRGKPEDDAFCNRIMGFFFKSIVKCKEAVLLAYLFNRNISESHVFNYLLKSGNISGDTSKEFKIIIKKIKSRLELVKTVIIPFNEGLLKNKVRIAKTILSKKLNNNIERYLVLLNGPKKHVNFLYFAAQNGHLGIVKLLAEQTSDLFSILLTRRDNNDKTPLLVAVEGGHLDIVKLLVKHGANINSRCKLGKTALIYAAVFRYTTILKYLIDSGAEINVKDNYGRTALYIAAGKDNLLAVRYLIERGADKNSQDNDEWSPLHVATVNNNSLVVKYLIKNDVKINLKDNSGTTALHNATRNSNLSLVKYITESGAEINSLDNSGRTPLHIVAGNKKVSTLKKNFRDRTAQHNKVTANDNLLIVKCLIKSGAEINCVDNEGRTALHIAKDNNNLSIVKYFVERGAEDNEDQTALEMIRGKDVNFLRVKNVNKSGAEIHSKDNAGGSVLHTAVGKENLSVVKYLIETGAGITSKNNRGSTVLHIAVDKNNLSLVKYLIESGAEINSKDNAGRTVLHIAVGKDNLPLMKFLIASGAVINSKDNAGRTVLHIAVGKDNLPLMKLLIASGADINSKVNAGSTVLHTAVGKENLSAVKYLIETGAVITSKDNCGRTVLHIAVDKENLSLVKYLIESGAKINSKDNTGRTVLHIAEDKNNFSLMKYLIETGAEINTVDNNGRTAIYTAISKNNLPVAQYLIESGANINPKNNFDSTAIHRAASKDNLTVAKYLLESGVNVNSKDVNNHNMTALHIAVEKDYLSLVKYLIERGSEINSKDNHGRTVLHIAVEKYNLSLVKYLIESGSEINSKDNHGRIVLHRAVEKDNLLLVKYLIETGADINSKDNDDRTAIYTAIGKDNLSVAQYLIESGANINPKNNFDSTAIHRAASKDNLTVAKYLLESGVNVNSKDVNNHNMTALHIAVEKDYLSLVKYLIERGSQINSKDNHGRTVLHIAVEKNYFSLVKYLIESGSEINSKDNHGRTVLHIAVKKGHLSLVKYLILSGLDINSVDNSGWTTLYHAVHGGHIPVLEYLLQQGAVPNRVDLY